MLSIWLAEPRVSALAVTSFSLTAHQFRLPNPFPHSSRHRLHLPSARNCGSSLSLPCAERSRLERSKSKPPRRSHVWYKPAFTYLTLTVISTRTCFPPCLRASCVPLLRD